MFRLVNIQTTTSQGYKSPYVKIQTTTSQGYSSLDEMLEGYLYDSIMDERYSKKYCLYKCTTLIYNYVNIKIYIISFKERKDKVC
jgi:hypothetical protein